jgi:hypothetical protein
MIGSMNGVDFIFLAVLGVVTPLFIFWLLLKFKGFGQLTDEQKMALVERLLKNLIPSAIWLVTEAENQFGSGKGLLKRAYVINFLYERIPDEFKGYVTEDNLAMILELALTSAKVIWEQYPEVIKTTAGARS